MDGQEVPFARATMFTKTIKPTPATTQAQLMHIAVIKQLKNIMQPALSEKLAKTASALTSPAVLIQIAEQTDTPENHFAILTIIPFTKITKFIPVLIQEP